MAQGEMKKLSVFLCLVCSLGGQFISQQEYKLPTLEGTKRVFFVAKMVEVGNETTYALHISTISQYGRDKTIIAEFQIEEIIFALDSLIILNKTTPKNPRASYSQMGYQIGGGLKDLEIGFSYGEGLTDAWFIRIDASIITFKDSNQIKSHFELILSEFREIQGEKLK